jgi:hypothetical protein
MPTLDGNKTYIIAAIYIASVIASHYYPAIDWDTIQAVIAGFGLVTLRHAITKNQPQPPKEEGKTNV